MDSTSEDEPRFYSQAAAAAMHDELERQRAENRRLLILNGALNREAETQAATIAQLREEAQLWRNRFLQAYGNGNH